MSFELSSLVFSFPPSQDLFVLLKSLPFNDLCKQSDLPFFQNISLKKSPDLKRYLPMSSVDTA